jgi:hypothetical protein
MSTTLLSSMNQKQKEKFQEELENKFYCSEKFTKEIEKIYQENSDMNYIDSIIYFCEGAKIDVQSVSKLITKQLKEKIKYEATELNFLKKTSKAKLLF